MALTPRGYPYPDYADVPSGPSQLEALAQALDTDVTALQTLLTPSSVVARRADATPVNSVDITPTHVVSYDLSVAVIGPDISFASGIATINRAGHYRWGASVQWPLGTGVVGAHLFRNGSVYEFGQHMHPRSSGQNVTSVPGDVLPLAVGDTLQLGLVSPDATVSGVLVRSFTIHRVAF